MPLCPNCSLAAGAAPGACPRCGYRPELAGEYLWIYLGGCGVLFFGFVVGALGIACEGVGPDHWSRVFHGWCPLWPWPPGYTWLGFLILGITLTGCGLGITRQKRPACIALGVIGVVEAALACLALAGVIGDGGGRAAAAIVLGVSALLVLVATRMGIAFRRTPARSFDAGRPQE